MNKPVMLLIMDGFGIAAPSKDNAISVARTPRLDALMAECTNARLAASGEAVGLPAGQMGNSEVGHTNIGAGRIIWQELLKINRAIADGSFFDNETMLAAMKHVNKNDSTLHVFGLMSDGGVHSHIEHIKAVCEMAKRNGVRKLYVHCFMDGRDTAPTSGASFVKDMEAHLASIGIGQIGSVIGRYYAMDRDKRWDRVKAAYDALTSPVLPGKVGGYEAVMAAYAMDETDEFIQERLCNGFDGIKDGDSIIFANFRPDRAREITRAFVEPEFSGFDRPRILQDLFYVCMTLYDANIPNVSIAYPPDRPKNTIGEYVSSLGFTQLRIAETEKYAHVTFFFNGGKEHAYPGESRILIPSPKVDTYDLKPEMSAYELTDKVIEVINEGKTDLIIMNLANCDMVGHTGIFDAAVKAVEAVDACVGRIADAIKTAGGRLVITADHGNAELMRDEAGEIVTAHSVNPVPVILVNDGRKLKDGALCDLAPTLLELMELDKPAEMEGSSLLA